MPQYNKSKGRFPMSSPTARILCTEDNADTRDLLVVLLQSQGYEVICTDNADDALTLARTQTYDLYLVDSWLPSSSGATLTEWIREFDKTTPILFYSGAAHDSDLQRALKAGATGYLIKPADNEKLLAEVFRLMAAQGQRKQLKPSSESVVRHQEGLMNSRNEVAEATGAHLERSSIT